MLGYAWAVKLSPIPWGLLIPQRKYQQTMVFHGCLGGAGFRPSTVRNLTFVPGPTTFTIPQERVGGCVTFVCYKAVAYHALPFFLSWESFFEGPGSPGQGSFWLLKGNQYVPTVDVPQPSNAFDWLILNSLVLVHLLKLTVCRPGILLKGNRIPSTAMGMINNPLGDGIPCKS